MYKNRHENKILYLREIQHVRADYVSICIFQIIPCFWVSKFSTGILMKSSIFSCMPHTLDGAGHCAVK